MNEIRTTPEELAQREAAYQGHRDECNTCNGSELCDIGESLFQSMALARGWEDRKDSVKPGTNPYTLKGLKTFTGMEGQGFNAKLVRDGKVVAALHDDGNGGCIFFDWVDRLHGASAEEKAFEAFIETERSKIPADKFISDLVDRTTLDRRLRRGVRTHTLYQVGDQIGGNAWMQVKGVGREVRAWVEKKYAGQKVRIINDEYSGG